MKRNVTVQQVVCDLCDSVIGQNNASVAGLAHDLKIMGKRLRCKLVVTMLYDDDAEDRPLDLCENCLREVLKSAGVV